MQLNYSHNKRKLSPSSVSAEDPLYPIIPLSENMNIPTYYLIISATICIALVWMNARSEHFDLNQRHTLDLSLILMIAGFIGGRLFHVIYEEPTYYAENPFQIFAFWNGGFVYYGGALLAAACALAYAYKKDRGSIPNYLDLFAPVIALTYALGRTACLLAGCCYGRFCDLPWAISGRHPTQAYAALWEIGVVFLLLGLEKRPHTPGLIFYIWMVLHGVGRLLMELFRDDFRGPQWGISISSWISLALIAGGACLILRLIKGDGKRRSS